MTEICDICGKERNDSYDEEIEGKVRISKIVKSEDTCCILMSSEMKEIYICPTCTRKIMKYIETMKGKKKWGKD